MESCEGPPLSKPVVERLPRLDAADSADWKIAGSAGHDDDAQRCDEERCRTNIVSAPISKRPDARILARLDEKGPECAIAAPVWHELTYGCSRLPRGKRRTALESYLRDVVRGSFPNLPYDEAAAEWHGEERARLESLGRPTPFVDGQIASIAHVHQLVLVTTNHHDFGRFKGLKIENWSQRATS